MPYLGSEPAQAALVAADIADNAVTTAKINDDAVTLAKMASGTDGEIITYDTSGNPDVVAVGTSGHFLKSAGAGAVPSFAADNKGTLIQQVSTVSTTFATHTTVMPADNTIPQNDEGAEILTRSITPTNALNILEIFMLWQGGNNATGEMQLALFQDSTAGALVTANDHYTDAGIIQIVSLYRMVAGTTSSTTFKMRQGNHSTGTVGTNGSYVSRRHGGVMATLMTIKEFAV